MPKQNESLDNPLATRKMLHHVRDELKSDILSVDNKIESLEKKMESKFASMESTLAKMNATLDRMAFRLERQDVDNGSLYELYKTVADRQDRQDIRLAEMHDTLRLIASSKLN